MKDGFDEFLNEQRISADVLQEAARTELLERIDDLPPETMREELAAAVGGEKELNAALQWLEDDPAAMRAASAAFLEEVWDDGNGEERVRLAIEDASAAMPVIETGIAAITAMYMTWLLVTKGRKSQELQTEKTTGPNGEQATKRHEKTEFWGPSGPLRVIVELFRGQ